MAEELVISEHLSKKEKYEEIIPQLQSLTTGEPDLIANLANIAAALKHYFNWFWVGFYFVKNDELVLGPFQGPIACTRIAKGKGVCGTSFSRKETIVVDDVDLFPGHISCNAASKSEIVVPVFDSTSNIVMVLDIDSQEIASFDNTDVHFLEKITALITTLL